MIEQEVVDPAQVRMSREEQRRRILLALEAPLEPQGSPTRASQAAPAVTPRQRHIAALRRSIPLQENPETRMAMADQLRALAAEEAAESRPGEPAMSGPTQPTRKRRTLPVSPRPRT